MILRRLLPTPGAALDKAPKMECGFHLACGTVQPELCRVVYGGVERFPVADGVEAVSLDDPCEELASA